MLSAIRHGLKNLFVFEGRDGRQAFWYYVLFLYLLDMGVNAVVSVPMTMRSLMAGVEQGMAQAGDPAAAQVATQSAMAASMGNFAELTIWASLVGGAIMLLGVAASLVRRLHDGGLSGYWALLPLGLQLVGLAMLPSQIGTMKQMFSAQAVDPLAALDMIPAAFGIGPVAGLVAAAVTILLGVRKSTPGPNRFGAVSFNA